jgi:hypothetical protein
VSLNQQGQRLYVQADNYRLATIHPEPSVNREALTCIDHSSAVFSVQGPRFPLRSIEAYN